jgi:hypothetical protein
VFLGAVSSLDMIQQKHDREDIERAFAKVIAALRK